MQLNQIARGEADAGGFLQGIIRMLKELISRYSGVSEKQKEQFSHGTKKESMGSCPRCGKPVYEGQKNFYCSDRKCQFALWKNDRFFESQGKKMDAGTVKNCLQKEKSIIKTCVPKRRAELMKQLLLWQIPGRAM